MLSPNDQSLRETMKDHEFSDYISRRHFVRRTAAGAIALGTASSLGLFSALAQTNASTAAAEPPKPWTPPDAPNSPIGIGRGLFPGRVTFVRDSKAARWDGKTGRWWDRDNIDEAVLADIVAKSLLALTGTGAESAAWKALFSSFNQKQKRGDKGYQPGETIAIKINVNNTVQYESAGNNIDQSPQATRALLRQLTGPGGVSQKDILVYDASVGWKVRALPDRIYDPLHAEFPGVRWMDGQGLKGREAAEWVDGAITYSSPETALGEMLPKQIIDATYLINCALFKGHEISGVTLCAKNHFGSIKFPQHDHRKYVSQWRRPPGSYSGYVDLMGSPNLGGKTVLYMVDGLYGMMTNVGSPKPERDRFKKLFNGEWSSCYFMSQDPVAIDSVCLDFLRTEFPTDLGFSGSKMFPLGSIHNCDNYLHEAANGSNAVLGPYKPNGIPCGSLGVHEHWNNEQEKRYSRNLSPSGKGIELISA